MKDDWLIVGLGYVGLTYAVHLANNTSLSVSGTDINPQKILDLRRGECYIYETTFADEFQEATQTNNLNFFLPELISKQFDALLVCIETPLPSDNYDVEIGRFVDSLLPYTNHLVQKGALLLRSTVSIGTTNKVREELVKRGRDDVTVIFLPERTAAGAAVEELAILPQLYGVALGCDKEIARKILSPIDTELVELSSSEAAEVTKLLGNVWRDSTFALSNSIAALALELKLNAGEIIAAANNGYTRHSIPRPGFVGGPCLSKDTYILGLHPSASKSAGLFIEGRKVNEITTRQIVSEVFDILSRTNCSSVYIVGITFKGFPETNDIRESLGSHLVDEIRINYPSCQLYVIDPLQLHIKTETVKANFVSIAELQSDSLIIISNNYNFVDSADFISSITELGEDIHIYDASGTAGSLAHLPNYIKFGDYGVD